MKEYIKFILLLMMGCALQAAAERIYGLERMERLDLLPYLLEGTQIRQVSSHDRAGGNDDGFNGTYSALYVDANGEYVLFDDVGAGCLYRFWTTFVSQTTPYATSRVRFYFDNETVPRVDLELREFFDGIGSPLEFPLVGPYYTSSLGSYCYVPFPYRERLKITLSVEPRYYNMTYHHYDSAIGIETWTGSEDQSAVLAQWGAAGADPKPAVSNQVVSGSLSLAAGETADLFRTDGVGAIQSIRIDPTPGNENMPSNLWIRMNWDGGSPEVEVPVGDFFGSKEAEIEVASTMIGMTTSGYWYCYFPMPFWQSAEIQLVNPGGEALSNLLYEVAYSTNVYNRAEAGYFRARFNEQFMQRDGRDFDVLTERGRGHVVGLSMHMKGESQSLTYLEGDERIYVDGRLSPSIYGTGNEDYFNGGWYFGEEECSLPYHGNPWKHHELPGVARTQAYRLHLSDLIPFNESIRFGMEHGPDNNVPATFSSVVYYYMQEAPGLVLTADLDLTDAWAEQLYMYQASTSATTVSDSWRYEGDDDDLGIFDRGYSFSNDLSGFTVPLLPETLGLQLRRRSDQGFGGQAADVFVDDVWAGIWYEGDFNFLDVNKRWIDSEFLVSADLLSGKSAVRISIVPSSPVWNEYRYEAFCVLPFEVMDDTDADGLPDGYETNLVGTIELLGATDDFDGDGFSDYEEYVAGTYPTNAASYLALDPDLVFESVPGRLYEIQESTDLMDPVWESLRSGIPGTGGTIPVPPEPGKPRAYYRLKVELP